MGVPSIRVPYYIGDPKRDPNLEKHCGKVSGCGVLEYVHTYIHTYMHAYIHTYIYTYIHTYIHTYIQIHICMYSFVLTYMHMRGQRAFEP